MEAAAQSKKPQDVTALKVLIADDDPPTRILLRAALSQWGYEVIEAKDGEEAWELLQKPSPPRLMIIDWLMPKLDGIGLCQKMKEKPDYHPYIILLTQVTGSTNIIKGLEAGANEFLSKPFNMAELRSRLSVGAKIIEFENLLHAKTDELNANIELVKKIQSQMLKLSADFKTHLAGLPVEKQSEMGIQTIRQSIDEMVQEIEAMQFKS